MKKFVIIFLIAVCCVASNASHNYPYVMFKADFVGLEALPDTNEMFVRLDHINAPVTVDNFLKHVNFGLYNSSIIHRGDNNPDYSIIQGGGWAYFNNKFYTFPIYIPIINESYNGLKNKRGTIAMARTSDPNSASTQFYFNQRDNFLFDRNERSYGYAVFGEIESGIELVDYIANLPTINMYDPNFPQSASLQTLPYPPMTVFQDVSVLPCDVTYCVDYVDDEIIDFQDYSAFAQQYGRTDCNSSNFFCFDTDLDFDGSVSLSDLAIFMQLWYLYVGSDPVLSDFDQNGTVNLPDLNMLSFWWLDDNCTISNSFCEGADLNQDGIVDFIDYQLFASNWLKSI